MGYVKQEHKVDEYGIHVPVVEYCDETTSSIYQTLVTREDFVRSYVKYTLMPQVKAKMKLKGSAWINTTDEKVEQELVEGFLTKNFKNYLLELL